VKKANYRHLASRIWELGDLMRRKVERHEYLREHDFGSGVKVGVVADPLMSYGTST